MFINSKNLSKIIFLILLFFPFVMTSQYYNEKVEGKLKIENNDDFLTVTGVASNKLPVNKSLRYELSVIKSNGGNNSKNSQSGRFTLEPNAIKELSTTSINLDTDSKVIILLLIYDLKDNLLGKDRYVINGDKEEQQEEQDIKTYNEEVKKKDRPDGIVLRGIVTEDTKTKAGNDFFNYFYSNYRNAKINSEKIIVIEEQFNMGRSTKILIKIDNKLVFQFFAQPKEDYLQSMADVSLRRVSRYLQQLERDEESIKRY